MPVKYKEIRPLIECLAPSINAFEIAIGAKQSRIDKALKRNGGESDVSLDVVQMISKAYPKVNRDFLENGRLPMMLENGKALSSEGQGESTTLGEAWSRIDTAVQAATEAAQAATEMARDVRTLIQNHESRIATGEASMDVLLEYLYHQLGAIRGTSPEEIEGEISSAMWKRLKTSKTGSQTEVGK